MYERNCSPGFTTIELLVVMAIMAILATVSVFTFQNFNERASLRSTSQEIHTTLMDARNKTLASDGEIQYGVHVDVDQVTLFEGSVYSSTSPSNVVYVFTGGVSASGTLVANDTDIVFSRLTGQSSASGTIEVVSQAGSATSSVSVWSSGLIE